MSLSRKGQKVDELLNMSTKELSRLVAVGRAVTYPPGRVRGWRLDLGAVDPLLSVSCESASMPSPCLVSIPCHIEPDVRLSLIQLLMVIGFPTCYFGLPTCGSHGGCNLAHALQQEPIGPPKFLRASLNTCHALRRPRQTFRMLTPKKKRIPGVGF